MEHLGKVIWAVMRPGETFPQHHSVDPIFAEDAQEEAAEAKEFKALVKAWTDYALSKGIKPLSSSLIKTNGSDK